MKYIYKLGEVPAGVKDQIGGKAYSLDYMIRELKLNVPSGFVVISPAFEDGQIRSEAQGDIEALVSSLDTSCTYAVRSSALSEDGQNASYAGQYETVTDVKADGITEAVRSVVASADSGRVKEYNDSIAHGSEGIAVVIQKFVAPLYAGVVFTSDPLNGKDEYLTGNYVKGEGEQLVSGNANAYEFKINALKFNYEGPDEMRGFAKKLGRACLAIRSSYGMPMDIEWAVSGGSVYILQARPITTLRRYDPSTYKINGSLSGYKLLTKTNVGEIFMQPVSPITFSVLDKISNMIGLPEWLDSINGQTYMNITVMMSAIVAFGKTREEAFLSIKDLVGNVPSGLDIPVSPFSKKVFFSKIKALLFPKNKSKLSKKEKLKMVDELADIARDLIGQIHKIDEASSLADFWDNVLVPNLNDGLASVLTACGTAMMPLFSTRKKIAAIAGDKMADRLCGGSLGVVDCMKPVLLIEDVIAGRITREEYMRDCGHRCVNEMELMSPRPYESEDYIDRLIEEHKNSGADLHAMQKTQASLFESALSEFKTSYPHKAKWIDKQIASFVHANQFREEIRSKGVWIFCVYREYLLRAGSLLNIGDDVFMLLHDEVNDVLRGKLNADSFIKERRKNYDSYLEYPPFPAVILGRFDPDKWMNDPNRRNDFYCDDVSRDADASGDGVIKGFPGASGVVTGTVRVIKDISEIEKIENGDILVTVATNIGWTLVFPKVSAIITDIGAPLSHAAIVAREFGIPAVVGCGNATTLLKTGDRVTVDGAAGVVKLISK